MRCLLICYKEQEKFEEALNISDQIKEAISTIGSQGLGLLHPIVKWLEAVWEGLLQQG